MRAFATLLLMCCLCGQAKAADPALPRPIAGESYHIVKNWDFAVNMLSVAALRRDFYTRYASAGGTQDHIGGEWEVYRDNDNHEISGGVLHLIARDPSGELKQGAIESGMIRSKWVGRYGYYEVSMKVPKGRGMWPAFWFATKVWPPEIDAVEIIDNGRTTTLGSFHVVHGKFAGPTVSSLLDSGKMYRPGFDYAEGFHKIAIEWTPDVVRHYVDDVLVVERKFEWRQNNGRPAPPPPVVINLAVGGAWTGAPISLSEFPASLDIAYIRIWQK